jgi:sodium transport system permease protein
MRWTVVRLIAAKEFRDLLRDRRTLLMILLLPVVLYPIFGLSAYLFAATLLSKPAVVGVVRLTALPAGDTPPLVVGDRFAPGLDDSDEAAITGMTVVPLTGDPATALANRSIDVVLTLPADLAAQLSRPDGSPVLRIGHREGDEKSKIAAKRLAGVLRKWGDELRASRFANAGLPADFHQVFRVEDSLTDKPKEKKAADELRDTFARVFPFLLIMWLLAGAIQPAVDATAGEKERGTMETLLISPAHRSEIVFGKFLSTAAFAFLSVCWNVVWLSAGALIIGRVLGFPIVNPAGLLGSLVLGVPLACFFSAICLALGIFAKSTKEGQYYLMPLVLLTMPLAFWSMLPGVELTPGMAVVPVTGPMLLQSHLLAVAPAELAWWYYPLVVGGALFWASLALILANVQFNRESVLFRETGPTRRRSWRRRSAEPAEVGAG